MPVRPPWAGFGRLPTSAAIPTSSWISRAMPHPALYFQQNLFPLATGNAWLSWCGEPLAAPLLAVCVRTRRVWDAGTLFALVSQCRCPTSVILCPAGEELGCLEGGREPERSAQGLFTAPQDQRQALGGAPQARVSFSSEARAPVSRVCAGARRLSYGKNVPGFCSESGAIIRGSGAADTAARAPVTPPRTFSA
ncbi:hypothetical protein CB1_000273023 [Camelus ferus]|nr:hypothetical protein CB1_000273023 [Camelus ferus]